MRWARGNERTNAPQFTLSFPASHAAFGTGWYDTGTGSTGYLYEVTAVVKAGDSHATAYSFKTDWLTASLVGPQKEPLPVGTGAAYHVQLIDTAAITTPLPETPSQQTDDTEYPPAEESEQPAG